MPEVDERRLAFGRVAELYERARPSYPPVTIDSLLELAGLDAGAQVLELGAGTGKGTRLLAERGLTVTALEPDPEMAAVAARNCAGHANVRIEQRPFESWQPAGPVGAVVSFQAWHWIDPATRYERAARALGEGGTLAAIWTFPDWSTTALRDALLATYAHAVPALAPDFPMHPASENTRLAGDWASEIATSTSFTRPQVHEHRWSVRYSPSDYCELLQTHQDHILLAPGEQAKLLRGVTETVEAAGAIDLDYVTLLCLACVG
jgi:SAM-dependent methyltransferase